MKENLNQDFGQALELGMQELEAMEAPGWWSVGGYISGAGVSGAVTYSIVATAIAAT
ncbi:daptide-type RiPP [Streptomyces sp. NPDC051211]|uniref:daptide-type RiPP n=1 Tax=Streptomyces sp. NPDC051211 TaxID=3154643 RepID=UPI00344F26F4